MVTIKYIYIYITKDTLPYIDYLKGQQGRHGGIRGKKAEERKQREEGKLCIYSHRELTLAKCKLNCISRQSKQAVVM